MKILINWESYNPLPLEDHVMKTEQQVFEMLDRFMEIDPKNAEMETIITALDWVLHRIEDEDMIEIADSSGH